MIAHTTLPTRHRARPHATDPLEWQIGDNGGHTEAVGIFPNEAAIARLIGAVLMERDNAWAVRRAWHMSLETIAPMSDDPLVSLPALPR